MTVTFEGKNAFPNKYIKCADLGGADVPLTIASVNLETLENHITGEKSQEWIMRFQEFKEREGTDKPHLFVLGKTKCEQIAVALKEAEMQKWDGRKIVLYPTRVRAFGQMTDAIRIRDKEPKAKAS